MDSATIDALCFYPTILAAAIGAYVIGTAPDRAHATIRVQEQRVVQTEQRPYQVDSFAVTSRYGVRHCVVVRETQKVMGGGTVSLAIDCTD